MNVLFIGNSYTAVNDLPRLVAGLARAGRHPIAADSLAGGAMALCDHVAAAETARKLQSRKWAYVVLQEQSVLPALAGERDRWMYPAVRTLAEAARAQGAEPVLYLTWPRKDILREFGFASLEAMQAALTEGYLAIGHEIGAPVAPVGPAWLAAMARAPGLGLWQPDGSHPSLAGSYLAACVLYATLFGESPAGLPAPPGIPPDGVSTLQAVAAEGVRPPRRSRE